MHPSPLVQARGVPGTTLPMMSPACLVKVGGGIHAPMANQVIMPPLDANARPMHAQCTPNAHAQCHARPIPNALSSWAFFFLDQPPPEDDGEAPIQEKPVPKPRLTEADELAALQKKVGHDAWLP
tara:strand:+ start:21 stop:395 length:375 start_codon:yes stop_codon:yes gene_type:complete